MRIIKVLETKMDCEHKLGEDHYCETDARYELEDDKGKHYVYCNKHAFERLFPKISQLDLEKKEPFFDGRDFFNPNPSKINLLEKIIYMPILLIVVIVKWIIKLQDRRKRKV